ncbi:transporter substrate-binding domain-containing protein [Marinomonas sp. 15G1-11]|uniref:Transporter substrate-binding domain-containing protein n=1 Tax=Marinomonas phaeophyticola TaxID=3004091 RepID=A0ABT4JTQ6_9GAMM|nr:transporter substrate-binding domain-containing protein [Marinomonas sp. 15G1-11]MCZ2721586.1 transporter substrate-binding domain-containing protein [Marinomonas sp. 15G1-11]
MSKNSKQAVKKLQAFVTLSLCLILAGVASIGHTKTLKVCYDHWAPMTIFPSESSPDRGVVIDMLEQIYESEGYTLIYYEVPLARGLNMVEEGLCDMLPEYLFSKKSTVGFAYAKEETFSYTTAFVVRKDDPWVYSGIQSIKGRRIATGPGWDYSSMSMDYQDYLDDPKNAKSVEVIAGYDDVVDRIFRMIKEGRIDLYADNELVLQHVLNQVDLNNELKIVYPGLENKLIEMPIFSKKIPLIKRQEIIKIWNKGRLSMRGKEETLLKKYKIKFEE